MTTTAATLADEFPAETLLPGGELLRRVRAIITELGISVYQEANPGDEVVLVFKSRFITAPDLPATHAPRRRRRYDLETEDGPVKVNATLGCMCVFPSLRGYTPETLAQAVHRNLIPYRPSAR